MTTAQDDTDVTLDRLLTAMREMRDGNFRRRLVVPRGGVAAELAEVFNEIAERNQWLVGELVRVRQGVGQEGRLGDRMASGAGPAGWALAVDSVNGLIDDLTRPTAELSRVLAAVAEGDLSQEITVAARGEVAAVVESFNSMTATLRTFAGEVTRVAREIGTDGRLGGQAEVPGVGGTWKDLTDSVNFMSGNLTAQVRDIAQVATAVAQGDLSQKITVTVAGEMLELKDTVNTMVDQLSAFADEVTRVAREVGTEG
ncbi:HAMP domain-containing protein, partial [Saccharothrix coeruleofusca]